MSAALSIEARALRLFGAPPAAHATTAGAVLAALTPGGEPGVVGREIDRLYRGRVIHLSHVRALRVWAERGREPCRFRNRVDAMLWHEAIAALDAPLRLRGIVR